MFQLGYPNHPLIDFTCWAWVSHFGLCTFCMLNKTITLDILNLSITIQPLCTSHSRLEHHTLACALAFTFFENHTSCSLVFSYTLLFLHMGFAVYKMSFWSFHTLMFIICTWVFIFVSLSLQAFLLLLFFVLFLFCNS